MPKKKVNYTLRVSPEMRDAMDAWDARTETCDPPKHKVSILLRSYLNRVLKLEKRHDNKRKT